MCGILHAFPVFFLVQTMMSEFFQTAQQNISQHIANVYEENELPAEATDKKYLSVRQEGERQVKRSLDMIISAGYKVESHVAARSRM